MFSSTKIIELGSCAFRQPQATSHCRFIHGYRLVGKFWFGANELDENNWVVDFGGLKDLKKKLEEHFDHTTVIADNDPALESFKKLYINNQHKLLLKGNLYPSFTIYSGVRQGCPLSPYLFLIIMTTLFHDIHNNDPQNLIRHRITGTDYDEILYADDTLVFGTYSRNISFL